MAATDEDDDPLGTAIRRRLDEMAAEHEAAKAAKAPCQCRKCPACKHAMHIGFIGWLYDHGYLPGDDYPEPLTPAEHDRLWRLWHG